ncbi:MAG: Xaa-Pro aminopeptidase [Bacteroidales bacterium]|jgi:Xaa-Pro aminopeptidase|nr:Xaa-Pro aminopeptidase [Bacteroidales bacterium]MDN5329535.1 Xaa-Pro aminopeptidase [Bacteroidales bacterium]
MFDASVYTQRRNALRSRMNKGIVLLPGNTEAPMNYPANTYHFRQDSNFLYFFGLSQPDLAGLIDLDNGTDILFGDDFGIEDIIWMGPQPSMAERAALVGITNTQPLGELANYLSAALAAGRQVHFVPPYRAETQLWLSSLLGIRPSFLKKYASRELIQAIVSLREIKEEDEIAEIEKMVDVARLMHTTAMQMAHPGTTEQEIFGRMEGIALSKANGTSFPIILSINGQTLHNHYHGNMLSEGRLLVSDAGCESADGYCSDITRSIPVGGKFSKKQKDIYQIVLSANETAIEESKPGVFYRDIHLMAARMIAAGLRDLGLMKGNIDDAVAAGAHALFFPHGLGHQMGLDVHDMEGLGENFVGYNDEISRSTQFGLAYLRMAKRLQPGHVITVEPGIYFIPALIWQWKEQNLHTDFINYSEVEKYIDFGGIRIEDDILITPDGCRVLGTPIPKSVADVEAEIAKGL